MKKLSYNLAKKYKIIDKFNNFDYESSKLSDEVYAKSFYNYRPTTKLINSCGVGEATFPVSLNSTEEEALDIAEINIDAVKGVAYFKQFFPDSGMTEHRLLIYGDDNKVYINPMFNSNYLYWLYQLSFSTAPITLCYKKDDNDAIILASEDSMMVWKTNYNPYAITNTPIITSMCINEDVLFCTIKEPAFKLWYATDLDAENVGNISKNSGYVSLSDDLGYARKVITYNENVYVIRDYGITKVNYVKGNITTSQIYLSDTMILHNTVSVSGNVVLFMTKNGLYSFNGVKVSAVDQSINTLLDVDNDFATASSLAGKYYLAVRLHFDDSESILCEEGNYVNNALFVIDTSDFSYELLRGVDIGSLMPLKTDCCEKMLMTFNTDKENKLGQIVSTSTYFGSPLKKSWKSGELVGNEKLKLYTKLNVYAKDGVTINIIHDAGSTSFMCYKDGLNEFNFKISSKQIKIEISYDGLDGEVERIVLEYYEN